MVKNSLPFISVSVAYASKTEQSLIQLQVPDQATIRQVISLSGILTRFPEIDLDHQQVGIFSKIKNLSDIVHHEDRIEIYRPLTIDPKEARRAKAKIKNQTRPV